MSHDNSNNNTSSASSIKAADDMGEGDTPLPSLSGDVSMTNAGATKDDDSDAKKRKVSRVSKENSVPLFSFTSYLPCPQPT
jgi:hypothetical protein